MGPYEAALRAAHHQRRAKFWPEIPVDDGTENEPAPVQTCAGEPPRPVNWMPCAPEGFVFPVSKEELREERERTAETINRTSAQQIRAIMKVVSLEYGTSPDELMSERRTANIVLPRQIAMYLAKKTTLRSLPHIGRRFGGRDHTTVLHAVRKIERLTASDPDLAATIARLEAQLSQ